MMIYPSELAEIIIGPSKCKVGLSAYASIFLFLFLFFFKVDSYASS